MAVHQFLCEFGANSQYLHGPNNHKLKFSFKTDLAGRNTISGGIHILVPAIKNFKAQSPKKVNSKQKSQSIRQQSIMSDCQQIDSNSHGLTYLTWCIY